MFNLMHHDVFLKCDSYSTDCDCIDIIMPCWMLYSIILTFWIIQLVDPQKRGTSCGEIEECLLYVWEDLVIKFAGIFLLKLSALINSDVPPLMREVFSADSWSFLKVVKYITFLNMFSCLRINVCIYIPKLTLIKMNFSVDCK